ncbi:hypothetical protein DM02DRAFT_592717 [Periconia macrospinosa]|uniref:Cora-domain-containing protein n=1 Tax=Periconia macrospinosa TaxID=97972 RepID=A0A2V1DRD6_9PLEO|nr:hypothetical protein DM02DRAFT_592717 [Periconia macrospinosa]
MLRLQRQKVLDECKWEPENGQLRYIEARTFANTGRHAITSENYEEGDLSDEDIDDWLHQRGRFTRPTSRLGKEEGSIRLLICERLGFHPLRFGLSKASFLAVENELGLPTEMLPLFKFNGGGHSYYFRPSASHDQIPEQLVITIKVPQMYQVANYGLCLTHSFKTHVTLGFMFGWNMINDESWGKSMSIERPRYLKPHSSQISELIKSEILNCGHPLLLPVILFEDHIYNADRYKGFDLSPRTTRLEEQLGVTKAGRNVLSSPFDFGAKSRSMTVERRFEIITDINTTVTEVITFMVNLKWDNRYCQFLRDMSIDIRKFTDFTQGGEPNLESTIETLATLTVSILEHAESIKGRLDIQLNVLYNLVTQVDSNLNATIAATTGLDSVAMKALAFVTTVFLPPTFTLFSMSMFDWQADGRAQSSNPNEGTKVVSNYFWMYWVISVPLTIVVLLTWRIWWHREKKHYQKKYPHAKLDRFFLHTDDSNVSIVLKRLITKMWKPKKVEDIELI